MPEYCISMNVLHASSVAQWEEFLIAQNYSPFLQSWTMGDVYDSIGEVPIRLVIEEGASIAAVCQAIVVDAKRGKHLSVLYGPVLGAMSDERLAISVLIDELKNIAKEKDCSFIRVSPFMSCEHASMFHELGFRPAPLHQLAEHVWLLNLRNKTEEEILMNMRKTTRNLIRRAEKEGVVVKASDDPVRDLPIFFELYDETRKRHGFVPYSKKFIEAQVKNFSSKGECVFYIARYNGEPVSASIHMIYGGETSYHHGASTHKYPKIPASYLLQWRAIQDAIKRGDHIYNFWGIAPEGIAKHPFRGVTTFKTGFGGELLELMPCMDLPLSPKYYVTRLIETVRKMKRGF